MKPVAFCLPKYFPFGGLQDHFLRIALRCQEAGHSIQVYTLEWQGPIPAGFQVQILKPRAWRNHARVAEFVQRVTSYLQSGEYARVVGFMKMPELDFYYAADPCFRCKAQRERSAWYRLRPRYRGFQALEEAVFQATAKTHILALTEQAIEEYRGAYGTPLERFHQLPPGIRTDRKRPEDASLQAIALRHELGLTGNHLVLLSIGTGFHTKGVDRSIRALAALPPQLRERAVLVVVGEGRQRPLQRLARRLDLPPGQLRLLGGRRDVPRLLFTADLLLHPARSENTGNVLLEATVAGLPVLTTANCGWALHIRAAGSGRVVATPFHQATFNQTLEEMLQALSTAPWSANGVRYGQTQDLYHRAEAAAALILRGIP